MIMRTRTRRHALMLGECHFSEQGEVFSLLTLGGHECSGYRVSGVQRASTVEIRMDANHAHTTCTANQHEQPFNRLAPLFFCHFPTLFCLTAFCGGQPEEASARWESDALGIAALNRAGSGRLRKTVHGSKTSCTPKRQLFNNGMYTSQYVHFQ